MYDRYYSKNSGAVCYLICLNLLSMEEDIQVTRNNDGFVVLSFIPTDERMDAFRHYIKSFKDRDELLVDIVNYNSVFSLIKRRINEYKINHGIK